MISKNRIKYLHSLEHKKNRKAEGVFIAEGRKLVEDLLPLMKCEYACFTQECITQLTNNLPSFHVNINTLTCSIKMKEDMINDFTCDIVTDDELKRISNQDSPQGIIAVFQQPLYHHDIVSSCRENLCIALDDVQNPGNLGTIMRLADWFGIEDIFCSQGCADIYNPKTVQATMGALARVRVHYCNLTEEFKKLSTLSVPILATSLNGENIYSKNLKQIRNGILVMGNEGNGVSPQVAAFANEQLYIPNYPEGRKTSESLNVAIATAIVCAELRRNA